MLLKKFGINKTNVLVNFGSYFNFATKMRAGVVKNKKDSAGRRLGVKKFGGEEVRENQIIVRQRGFKWKAGENVHFGRDQTLHATKEGKVTFTQDPWTEDRKVFVNVIEQEIPNRKLNFPKPFMYHPELYPELAKRNYKAEPLTIRRDLVEKSKEVETLRRKAIKAANKEIVILNNESNFSKSTNNLRNSILQSAKLADKINPENYTARFDIKPILNEISNIGVKYFIPDQNEMKEKNYERGRYELEAEEKGINPSPLGLFQNERPFNLRIYDNLKRLGNNSYSKLQEIYAKYVNQQELNKPIPLRDLMAKMKREKLLDPSLDIRKVPKDALLKPDQKIFNNELVQEKINLEGLLNNLEKMNNDELNTLYDEYYVNSKSQLESLLNKDLESVNTQITMRFLKLAYNDKKDAEIRKKQLPKIVANKIKTH